MYRKSPSSLVKHADFMLLDIICLEISLILSYILSVQSLDILGTAKYRSAAAAIVLIHICVVTFLESYKNVLRRGYYIEFISVIRHVIMVLMGELFFFFFTKITVDFTRRVATYFFIISIVLLYCERIIWKHIVKARRLNGTSQNILILVAAKSNCEAVLKRLYEKPHCIFVSGIILLDGTSQDRMVGTTPVVAVDSTALAYLERNAVDEVMFCIPNDMDLPERLLRSCQMMGLTVHLEIPQEKRILDFQSVGQIADITVLTSYIKMVTAGQLLLKRTIDICGAVIGLILTGVITLFLGPAIYLADPGPIFFSQERIGKNGRSFRIYKFRSMYQDAEKRKKDLLDQNEMSGFMFKMEADPRIIGSGPDGTRHGLGHFIRSSSLDEFPQFWNVLKGDMSLVGTRPPTVDEWNQYELHHRARMAAKPGITGMWQVSGRSDISDFEEVVRLDTEYIQNWNIQLDIKILLKTVLVVFKRSGSR